jgi:hypothetical protein
MKVTLTFTDKDALSVEQSLREKVLADTRAKFGRCVTFYRTPNGSIAYAFGNKVQPEEHSFIVDRLGFEFLTATYLPAKRYRPRLELVR